MNFTDRIRPTDKGITTYLDELKNLDYQIPTFQRNVVWEKENVKKLWDRVIPPKRAASKSRINTSPAFSAGRVGLLAPSLPFALY